MSDKITKSPQIRFAGFTDAWEQYKLGEFIQDYVEKTIVQNQYPVLTSSQKHGIVYQEEYFADRQVTTQNNIGYFVLPRGYFTFRSRSDNGIFKFNRNDLIDKGIISYFYPVFRISNGNSDFFLNMLNSTIKKQVALEAEGTGQRVLSLKKFKNINVVIPEIQEQTQIGNFFKQLVDTIRLHQHKLELLKETKKSLLQKMFPKDGANVPEIRFAGFADAWERRKLGEVTDIFDGTHQTPKYTESGVKFVSVENISNLETKKYISQEAYEKEYSNKQAEKGDVLMTRIGDIGTSKVIETDQPLAYYVTLALLKPKSMDSDFLSWLLASPVVQRDIWKRTLHIAFPKKINLGEINQVKLILPGNAEQRIIGQFFKSLDNLITLHQRELNSLKNLKKSLLQQMFI